MLFSCLERHAVANITFGVLRDTDDSTWHPPLQVIGSGEEGSMRSTVTHRHTESLRVTENDLGSLFTRGLRNGVG